MNKLIKLLQQQIASQKRRHKEQECCHKEQPIELQHHLENQTKLLQMTANRPQNPETQVAATTWVQLHPILLLVILLQNHGKTIGQDFAPSPMHIWFLMSRSQKFF